ncbi:MAG TPA: glycosyltransferase family 61 protein [Coleofasciculaceae cyanobacterium]|jgi:capsular polysaccharide biosynthesis protein
MNILFINRAQAIRFLKTFLVIRFLKKSLYNQKLYKLIFNILTRKLFNLKIVSRKELASNSVEYCSLLFGVQETIITKNLINIDLLNIDYIPEALQPSINQVIKLKQPFVSELKNAQLVGPTAAVFDKDRQIIEESLPSIHDLPLRAFIAQKLLSRNTPHLDTVCSLVNAANHVYGHWITDCLMRLEGLEHYQNITGRKPILIINHNLRSWQIDSLKILGYEPNDYIQWTYNLNGLNAARLVVPSFRRQGTWIEPSACHWLRQRMLSNLPTIEKQEFPFSRRIYISRKKELGRSVINEDEVMEVLHPLGFVSYTLETMNFAEEMRLFSQAEIIIGTHGSGLTNMIFSQNRPTIIDFFGAWYTNWFFNLSASLGFHYTSFKCQPSGETFKLTRGNMVVDAVQLKQLVGKLIS